jgi:hypothetical protein
LTDLTTGPVGIGRLCRNPKDADGHGVSVVRPTLAYAN